MFFITFATKKYVLQYQIALTLIPNVGDITAKKLIAYCGSAEDVFKQKKPHLLKIPGIGELVANSVLNNSFVTDSLKRAEKEIDFIQKRNIQALFYTDVLYPQRLRHCEDSPILLYFKGKTDLNNAKILGIVGTRKATTYGKQICEQFINDLTALDVLIVSGLAYGIDIAAQKHALEKGLHTVGVVAHGLDRIYPAEHKKYAEIMYEQGGVITEFMSETNPDRENFPKRNRIIAGMCDAILIVEAKETGGALITAECANSYNRDVFAIPGRLNDEHSAGCNKYIRQNKAALVQSANDIIEMMNWDIISKENANKNNQIPLFVDLTEEETKIVNLIKEKGSSSIDFISIEADLPMSKTSSLLLQLEFKGVIKAMPGKMYNLN